MDSNFVPAVITSRNFPNNGRQNWCEIDNGGEEFGDQHDVLDTKRHTEDAYVRVPASLSQPEHVPWKPVSEELHVPTENTKLFLL
jgi:hypothetical protein